MLKNVKSPLEVYKIVMPWAQEKSVPATRHDKRRIAILPFANISANPADEYFADGMTEELIATMSRIGGLKVITRTSVMGYKGGQKKISDVAKELEVGTVLEGSVRKAGERLRITVQLIDSQLVSPSSVKRRSWLHVKLRGIGSLSVSRRFITE